MGETKERSLKRGIKSREKEKFGDTKQVQGAKGIFEFISAEGQKKK
ncbi:MAG: hypothetical protein LBD46_01620 [Endomicrobium sp.]|jgi:hypothetical protein|nr:hypothetical protein [Endomicrobium sp.]